MGLLPIFYLRFFVLLPLAFGQSESSSETRNGVLIGTAIVAVVAVAANIIQFVVNIGLLVELRKSRLVKNTYDIWKRNIILCY